MPHPSLACFRPLSPFKPFRICPLFSFAFSSSCRGEMTLPTMRCPSPCPLPTMHVGTTPVRSHYGREQPTARRAIPPTPPTCTYLGPIPNSEKGHRHTIHHTLARNLTLSPQPDTAGRLLPLRRASVARASVVQWGGTLASPVVTVITSSCLPHALRVALGCRAYLRCLLYFPSLPCRCPCRQQWLPSRVAQASHRVASVARRLRRPAKSRGAAAAASIHT